MNKLNFKKIITAITTIAGVAVIICFIGLIVWTAIQCTIANQEVNIDANAKAYIQKIYPGSTILDINCEYEQEDSDYECKSTIRTSNGIVMAIEVDCLCSCGKWKGCTLDSDSNGGRYETKYND